MKYVINREDVKEILTKIDANLQLIEVKGESVGNLWAARMMLKGIFDNLEEVKDEKPKEG